MLIDLDINDLKVIEYVLSQHIEFENYLYHGHFDDSLLDLHDKFFDILRGVDDE